MKKIIALLAISVFLTSCTNNTETEVIEEKVTNTEIEQTIEDIMKEEIKIESETNTGDTAIVIEEKKVKTETTDEVSSDEAALELEVNDLLDEFIDSLDSYDK